MTDIRNTTAQLIKNEDWKNLKNFINDIGAVKIAQLIEATPEKEDLILFRLLDRSLAKEVFKLLSFSQQVQITEALVQKEQQLSDLINDIEPDDRTTFFKNLPGQVTQQLIQLLTPEERKTAVQLLGYPKDSIGRLMTPEHVAVKPTDTVKETLEHIRNYGKNSETLNVLYIVTANWELIGDIKIKKILLADPQQKIEDLMDSHFVALDANDDQEIAVKIFRDYDRVALPVVNAEGILIGIITIDDIMDVEKGEVTEDFHKFGSFQSAIANPLKERLFLLYKNRIFWLLALVFMNVFSGAAISSFENLIESVVALVFFLPLLIDSGGNAGAQSATLMIRSLAIGDVKMTDWYKLIGRELVVSLMLGVTMAAGVALVASFRAPEVIVVVSITMVLIVITGSLIGFLLPFLLTKLKLDPATASAPLITSIADICGVIIYFSTASWYFGI